MKKVSSIIISILAVFAIGFTLSAELAEVLASTPSGSGSEK